MAPPAPVGCSILVLGCGRGEGALLSLLLTLQLHLSVGVVEPTMVGHHPCCLQVGHDHLHAVVSGLPGLGAFRESLIPLQQGHEGYDVGKGGVGQGWSFWGERHS